MNSINIKSNHVTHLEADGNYTFIHYQDGTKKLVAKTLKKVLQYLSNDDFIRCHSKYAINIDFVEKVKKDIGYGYVSLTNHTSVIPISRRRKSDVFATLGGY